MSAPSSSVWSGRPSRPQSGARPAASSSAMPNMPTSTPTQPIASNTPTMPNIPPASSTPTPQPIPQLTQPTPQPTAPPTQTPPKSSPASRPSPRLSSDDIILPSSNPKPKGDKKPLIIGAIVLAGAAVIAGIVLLMTGAFNNNSGSVEATDAKGKFNIYANYLLFGEDSKENIPDFDQNELYTFENIFNQMNENNEEVTNEPSEENLQYINNLKNLFDDFYNAYSAQNSEVSESVNEYKDSLDFIYAYVNFVPPSDEEILSTANSNLAKFYQVFYDLGSSIGEEYADYSLKITENVVELAKIYEEAGCDFNQDPEAATTCLENANLSEESINKLSDINTILSDNESEMITLIDDSANNLIDECWSIKDEIN